MRPPVLALAAVLGALASGCGGDDDDGEASPMPPNSVQVRDFDFSPIDVEIKAGNRVTWRNTGEEIHTVKGRGFFSRAMNAGDMYGSTFDKKGSYDYVCTLHPQMKGTVVVR